MSKTYLDRAIELNYGVTSFGGTKVYRSSDLPNQPVSLTCPRCGSLPMDLSDFDSYLLPGVYVCKRGCVWREME